MSQLKYEDSNFLTSLRAIAVLMVFLMHADMSGGFGLGENIQYFVRLGELGVQVFFVISGYTIFSQFFQEGYGLKKFLLVRLARISIPYFPVVLLLYLAISLGLPQINSYATNFNGGIIDLFNLGAHLTYLSTFFLSYQNSIIGVEWTLGVEVFYYIVFGLLIHFKLIQRTMKSLVWTLIGGFLINVLFVIFYSRYQGDPNFLHWSPFGYSYMFLLGGIAYLARSSQWLKTTLSTRWRPLISDAIVLVTALALLLCCLFRLELRIVRILVVILTFAIIVFFQSKGKLSSLVDNPLFQGVGAISYSFYLLHFVVWKYFDHWVAPAIPYAWTFTITLLGSLVLAALWYWLFEKTVYSRVKTWIKSLP